MSRAIRWTLRHAWRRGVLGGSRAWQAAGVAAVAGEILRRAVSRREEVVYRETLDPGRGVVISHLAGPASGKAGRGGRAV